MSLFIQNVSHIVACSLKKNWYEIIMMKSDSVINLLCFVYI